MSKTPTETVEIKRERESVTWCQEGHSRKTESKNPVICSPIYSEDQIKNASRLFEKERMIFANKKAKEISSDAFFESWGFKKFVAL